MLKPIPPCSHESHLSIVGTIVSEVEDKVFQEIRIIGNGTEFRLKSFIAAIMHQLLRYASGLHVEIGLLPEKLPLRP
jgi:hypothetical protein